MIQIPKRFPLDLIPILYKLTSKFPFIFVVTVATLPSLAAMILQMILAAVLTFNP